VASVQWLSTDVDAAGERRKDLRKEGIVKSAARLLCYFGAMAWTSHAGADTLSEERVLRRARELHPLVAGARLDTEAAAGELQAAEGAFDSSLRARGVAIPFGGYPQARADVVAEVPTTLWGSSFFAGYRWGSDDVAVYDGKYITNEYGEVRAGVAVPLWRNGPIDRRRAGIERAELGREIAELALSQSIVDAQRTAGLRYWAWVGACMRRGEVERLFARAVQRASDTKERAASGDVAPVELVDAERSAVQRRQLLVSAERALQQAEIELSLYMPDDEGRPRLPSPDARPTAMPPLPRIPAGPSMTAEAVLARRPDVARLTKQAEQQDVERRWADNQLAPGFDVGSVVSKDLGPGSAKRSPTELEVGVTIDVPIDTDLARGRARAARATTARIGVAQAFVRSQVEAELRDATGALAAALEREKLASEERRLAFTNLEAERERLALGESTVFVVDLREQAALEASLRQIDAAIDARRATVAFRAAAAAFP
jgi:cobalt-zinc-cadmium efflux system outer membrane protein